MTLSQVAPGDPLSAAAQNLVVDQINALARPGAVGTAQYGSAGLTFCDPTETRLALFELTEAMNYPEVSGAVLEDPTPSARANFVWFSSQESGQASSGPAVRSYGPIAGSVPQTIWFPLVDRSSAGYGVWPPLAAVGTRVLAIFNRQSGRWEVVQGPPSHVVSWGRLSADLPAGGSVGVLLAQPSKPNDYTGVMITARDWLLPPGATIYTGTKVKVEYFPQDQCWWVTGAACF